MPSGSIIISFLFLCVANADAKISDCRKGVITAQSMSDNCNSKQNADLCSRFISDFGTACTEDVADAKDVLYRLRNKDDRTPAQEAEFQAAKADFEAARAALVDAQEAAERLQESKDPKLKYFVESQSQGSGIAGGLEATISMIDTDAPVEVRNAAVPDARTENALRELTATAVPPQAVDRAADAGEKALAGGRTEEAARVGEALVKYAPSDSRGPAMLAGAALSDHRPADAERWAQKALLLNPKDKKAQDALSFARSELSVEKLKKPVLGNFQEARAQDLAQGLAAGVPPRPPAGPPVPDAMNAAKAADPVPRVLAGLLRRGYEKMNLGDLPGGLDDVSVHLDSHPDDDAARLVRAEILLKLGKAGPALADIDAVLAKSPDDPRALRAKAAALYEIGGRDQEALTTIERALAVDPASGIGHLTRAKILEHLGRIPEAITEYRTAAQLDPALEPIVDAALRRLGAAPAAPAKAVERGLLRGGFLVVSLGFILLGLAGGAVVVTRRARTAELAAAAGERTLKAGDLVAGQYRITRELGRGGMGVVFEAVDEKLKRSVALKQLQGEHRSSAEEAARFLQEARLVAQLRHPNVAEIYAAVEDGGLYLVFELVRGRSLDAVLGAGVSPEQARGIVAHACAALTAAHARRIVHRDLKPSNMMISDAGELKVMDFGIAHQSMNGGAFTRTSASGTPPYMAPEQAMGSVSSSSDLYAMGVMAYELLAGVRPFPGPDFLGPKMRAEFAPVTSKRAALPARLDAFFASALSPDPARRPADAAAFAAAFAACWS